MKVTLTFLEKIKACKEAIQAWKDYSFEELDLSDLIEKLKSEKENIAKNYEDENSLLWATWLLPHCMENNESIINYANFCKDLALGCDASASELAAKDVAKAIRAANAAISAASAVSVSVSMLSASVRAAVSASNVASAAELVAGVVAGDKTSLQIIDYGINLLKKLPVSGR